MAQGGRASVPAALSDAALQRLAGSAVFARGEVYARDRRCVAAREGDSASEWLVHGSATYRVSLQLEGDGLDAECDCPYAGDEGFCKHMVAAALIWRERLGGAAAAPDAMLAFLQERPAAELAQRLVAWAGRDRALAAELKAWRAEHQGFDPAAWREAIDAALRQTRSFYDVPASGAYARQGATVLPLLRALVRHDPAVAREACVLALRRVFAVGEQADDSNGSIGSLLHEVHAVLLGALRAAPPAEPGAQRWLRTWLALQERDPWGLWNDEGMLDAAGPQVRAHYTRHVTREWEDWLSRRRAGGAADGGAWDARRWLVRSRYLADRRRHGDTEAVLAALRADLRSGNEAVELAAQLQALGREREALQALEHGARTFPGDWRIEEALLAAYERDGCHADALAIRRAQLERNPDTAHYAAALQAAEAAGHDREAYRQELHRWAEARETEPPPALGSFWRRQEACGNHVTVRVRWLLHDGRPLEALALARQEGRRVGEDAWHALALALRGCDVPAADGLFRQLVETRMRRAQSPYAEELVLVGEWLEALPQGEAAERLASLRAAYRAKRNFVAGLERLAAR